MSKGAEGFSDLPSMIAYIEQQRAGIKAVVAEMDQCQCAFTTRLVEQQQVAADSQAEALTTLDRQPAQVAPWLREQVDSRLAAVRQANDERIGQLRTQLQELQKERETIEAQSAEELQRLHTDNPALDAREEELKAQAAQQEAQVAKADEELRRAARGLGWLFGFGRVCRLRGEHRRLETALYGTRSRLAELRGAWQKEHDEVSASEEALQEKWRSCTARIAAYTEELQRLEDDPERAARRGALEAVIKEAAQAEPTGIPQADAAIARLIQCRAQIADAATGVADSAELVGLLNGIESGMEKLQTSVAAVYNEQQMHSELAALTLTAPKEVVEFHRLWARLVEVVRDEAAACSHPQEFHKSIRYAIGERLGQTQIEQMFAGMGDELSRATKSQWGS